MFDLASSVGDDLPSRKTVKPMLDFRGVLTGSPAKIARVWFLIGVVVLNGCASSVTLRVAEFSPRTPDEVGFKARAITQTEGLLRVSVAVLTTAESESVFGVPLARKGIQPVWLQVVNNSPVAYWFLDAGMDPNYFSPNEAAYKFTLPAGHNKPIEQRFHELSFANPIAPQSRVEGFVLTNLDQGTKAVNVDLVSRGQSSSFSFFVPIPDFRGDYQAVDFASLYAPDDMVAIEDEQRLRKMLEDLSCCTVDADGTDFGDPLNLVLIGQADDIFAAFLRRGWSPTEQTYAASIWRTVKSYFSGRPYRYSPVSPLYVFGRSQDISGQKARGSIHERNHLRLWLTSYRFRQRPVWVGQISRDIGIRLSFKVFPPVTHKIDPDVDEARNYLAEDLIYSGSLARFGLVKGVGNAPQARPRYNLGGDPYFTDGLRMVLEFSPQPHNLTEIEFIDWERPQPVEALVKPAK